MSLIDSFIDRAAGKDADRKGGNKKCWLFTNHALLIGSFKEEDIAYTKEKQAELVNEGVNLFPIVEYKAISEPSETGYQKGYILQRRAQGEELHNKPDTSKYQDTIANLAQENQEVFDKFVDDWMKICSKGLTPDPSKSANFFYEPGKRISFIDVEKGGRGSDNSYMFMESGTVLLGGGSYYSHAGNEGSKTQKDTGIILNKLKKSFVKLGFEEKTIDAEIENRWPDSQPKKASISNVNTQSKENDGW